MNFATSATLEAAARAHGFRSVAADASVKFDAMLLRLTRGLLEPAALVSSHRTIQPEHFASLRRIKALLVDGSDATSRRSGRPQRGGHAETVLPVRFFDAAGPQVGGCTTMLPPRYFNAAGPQIGGHGGHGDMIRQEMVSTFPRQQGGSGGAEARAAIASTFPATLLAQAGGGASWALPDDALARVLREYRARVGDVRISEPARRYLAAFLVRNTDRVLHDAARGAAKRASDGKGKPQGRRLTGAAIDRAAAKWKIEL